MHESDYLTYVLTKEEAFKRESLPQTQKTAIEWQHALWETEDKKLWVI